MVKAIEEGGGKAIAIQADSVDAEAIKAAVAKTVATFGSIDILVNNAGTAIPKPFEEATLEEFDRVLDINVGGSEKRGHFGRIKGTSTVVTLWSAGRASVPG